MSAVGFELGVHLNGHVVEVDTERERLIDGGGRHFPAHWEVREVRWIDGYWGWWRKNPKLRAFPPSHTYWKRGYSAVRWMDAT